MSQPNPNVIMLSVVMRSRSSAANGGQENANQGPGTTLWIANCCIAHLSRHMVTLPYILNETKELPTRSIGLRKKLMYAIPLVLTTTCN